MHFRDILVRAFNHPLASVLLCHVCKVLLEGWCRKANVFTLSGRKAQTPALKAIETLHLIENKRLRSD